MEWSPLQQAMVGACCLKCPFEGTQTRPPGDTAIPKTRQVRTAWLLKPTVVWKFGQLQEVISNTRDL